MIRIKVLQNGQEVTEFSEANPSQAISIGRARESAIKLDHPSISRAHAIIYNQDGDWVLERKSSFGLLKVNNVDVENAVLQGGEEVQIGDYVLHIEIQKGEPSVLAGAEMQFDTGDQNSDRTQMFNTSTVGMFRFEPGSANVAEFRMDGEVAVMGRASNCDVVLTDKKASRKHIEIQRKGLSFYLRDLQSANGVYVNEKKVTDCELVPGDVVRIGDSQFQFTIENKDYFSKEGEFLPVPQELLESNMQNVQPSTLQKIHQTPQATPSEPEEKSIFKRLWKKYKSLPTIQRYIVIGIVFSLTLAIFGEQDKPPTKSPVHHVGTRAFENLPPAKQLIIKKTYDEVLKAHEQRNYTVMLEDVTKILQLVDDYRDVKNYQEIAQKGIAEDERKEQERKREERQQKILTEVRHLEEEGRAIFNKALKDKKTRQDLSFIVHEIYSKQPDNRIAAEWEQKIQDLEEKEAKAKIDQEMQEKLRKQAETVLAEAKHLLLEKKYIDALALADDIQKIGYHNNSFNARVQKFKAETKTKLDSVINPLLQAAADQRKEGGDLVKAKDNYMQVLQIDKENSGAKKGLEEIKEVLHTRAKRLYAEAVLAESINSLDEARDKFEKCFKTAPDDDMYQLRCKNKLLKYEVFTPQKHE